MRHRLALLCFFIALPFLAAAGLAATQTAPRDGARSAAAAPAVSRPVSATIRYTVTSLGTLGGHSSRAMAINEAGQVVGDAWTAASENHAFLWENGNMMDLGVLHGTSSSANDINDDGVVAGWARNDENDQAAVIWQNGAIVELQHSGLRSYATAINGAGAVVGVADVGDGQLLDHAILWQNGALNDLGSLGSSHSWARDVNDAGQIAGDYYAVGTTKRGFLWDNGTMTDIGVDFGGGSSNVYGINDAGDLVGQSSTGAALHAFLKRADGTVVDLGTLGTHTAWAAAINNEGQIVGSATDGAGQCCRAVLWEEESIVDLNDLIDPDAGWVLEMATDINDAGQIVGHGTIDGQQRAFLLTPEPAWTLMFYLAGDNNLHDTYDPIFNQLELAADHPDVNVVVFRDGEQAGDSAYYHVQYDLDFDEPAEYEEGETKWSQGEANSGFPTTLSDFATWAMAEFPARHYALILDDHGSGLGGGLVDDTSGRSMSLPELQLALGTITGSTGETIDVLYSAMCLMGMIEDAYQFRGYADYYVANENLQWALHTPYYPYVDNTTAASTPAEVARNFADAYAGEAEDRGLDHTISVVEMAQLDPLIAATQQLGGELEWHMDEISPTVTAVLSNVQRFDNRAPRGITMADTSIDLRHFADLISVSLIDYGEIVIAATEVMSRLDDAVVHRRHGSDGDTDLSNSGGMAIFFPAHSSSFYHPDTYDFAVGANWDDIRSVNGEEAGTWGSMLVAYVRQVNPEGPDDPAPPPPVSKPWPESRLFLPLLLRP